jgi:hypothetical protein
MATLLCALSLHSTTSCASSVAERDERVMHAVEKVVAEYRIYATCLSLDPMALSLVNETWNREVLAGVDALKEIGPSAALAARFATTVAPSQLLDPTMRLSDAIEYCKATRAQVLNFYSLSVSRLAPVIREASAGKR